MKKVVRNIIFSVLTLYLSIACKNYTADIDEYLSYWTTEASIAGYVFNTATQTDAEGALCVSSKDPVTITFTVRNPKNFDFKMPGESDAPADIITFPHLQNAADVSALQAGDDYVFKKISGSTLELTYTPAFLRKHEWSSGNIAPAIMLYTNDGRVFKQTITLELKVNTPPPTIKYYAVAKTSAAVPGEDAYYVLCLQVPDMDTKITGGLLHKDIAGIEINGIRYPLSIDEEQQGFVKPENDAFLDITDVVPLDEHDAADIPSGWVLYFKTDAAVKTGSAKKDYTVKLTDTNGFTSSELKASTSPNKLPKEEWKVTKGDPTGEKSGTAAEPIIIGADSDGAAVSVSSKIPNTVVHCTLTEIGQEAEPEQTGIVSVTVDMPLKGKNEKTYKLEYYTDGEGFAATAPQTVYYNILLKHTVTFNLAGGNIGGKTDAITMTGTPGTPFTQPADPAKDGYNFSGWLPSLPSSPVFPKADTEYTAQWTKDGNTPYKIEHYQQNIDDDDYTLVSADTQSLKGEAEALIAVARKHYEGFTFDHQEPSAPTIAATGDTVVRVYYNRKEITLTFRLNGGIIGGKPDYVIGPGKFGKSFEPPIPTRDGYTPNGWKPALPSPPAFPAEDTIYTAQWKANTYTVTFDSKGGGSIPAQKVQYGSKISKPADPTAPAGYSFQNWCTDEGCITAWNFSSGTVKGDMTLYAKWIPLKVTYTVKHFQQNIDDDNYPTAPSATQTLSGTTGTLTTATANGYAGFEPLPIEQETIAGDGTTVVEVKYKRKRITVTFKLAGGNVSGSTADVTREGKFGAAFTAPTNPAKDGYTFNRWLPALPSPLVFPAANAEYTAQWQEIPKPGMRIKEGISAEEKSYEESGMDNLVLDSGHYTHTTPLIIYKESGQAKLSITGSGATTAYYQIDAGSETEGTEISLPADGNAYKLTVWAKKGTDDSIKTVLYIHVKDALTTYKELKNVVQHVASGTIINIGDNLSCGEEASEIEINKAVTIQRKSSSGNSRYTLDANEKGRFFKVTSGGTLTLKNIILKNGKAGGDILTNLGGGIHVLNGGMCQLANCIITECKAMSGGALAIAGNCTLTDSIVENNSCLTSGSAAAANIPFTGRFVVEGSSVIKDNKTADGSTDAAAIMVTGGITLKDSAKVGAGNNIHLSVASACITVDGNLTAAPTAAGVSMPAFSAGRKVLEGSLTSDNIGKFTLVGFHADQWKINASGELEAVGGQSPAVAVSNWEDLRTQVQSVSDGTVIEVTQDITYKGGSSESTITVNKNITIKSKKSKDSNTYTLNADCTGTFPTYASKVKSIFEVSGGKTLTLENVTLSNAKQYAVSVAENCSLMMTKVTIKDCTTTQDNAAGIYFNKGKNLTLTGCTIEKCKGTGSASFGGINIQEPKGTVSIKDTIIKNCKTKENGSGTGGGIYLYKAAGTLENVKVDSCSAKSGGGIYVKGGTLTITGGSFINNSTGGTGQSDGGGAIYNEGAKVTITGCTIGDDDSRKDNLAVQGGGIFVDGGAECILEAGTKIIGNGTIGLGTGTGNGGGVYVAGNSSLKMENVTIKNCEATGTDSAGGGVYLYKGTCTLEKVSVEGCKAPKGGGIFVSKEAECILKEDVKILQNEAIGTNSNGGGIFVDKVQNGEQSGTLTIKGSKEKPVVIAKNTADNHGGGLYSFGTVTIEYAEIKENKVTHDGGGMYNAGICTMNYVTIQNNRASDSTTNAGRGGGIYSDETLTLTNTTVADNEATTGGGIYIAEHSKAFNMSGSTVITVDPSKNDVFLRTGRLITISGALTATGIVARITPENYTAGVKVLEVSSNDYTKFTVTPKGTEIWSIKSDGTLKK
ncbi:InlB B-repeat-containing protein [Treponema vincentii]|uniref:InlB B-repeat-containing protein n=1 Tax=Treponema vincentii TaxID=69710 RepID=UPI0020A601BB|nr:InlB B-repeat-containing protein [Treponema vincentii]UTC60914.1 InlB B-repeat-containing protein [Treponema vincentii]